MSKETKTKGLLGIGVVTAIASSLCCITPVLALVAGSSGAASSFSWIEPARPYLIGLTIIVLAFAWGQKLKPKKVDDCGCSIEEKPKFLQTKLFLGMVTAFAIVMTLFPYYSHLFYSDNSDNTIVVDQKDKQELVIKVEGMTCDACQNHIDHTVNEVDGVISSQSSYDNGSTTVVFDKSKTSYDQIVAAINSTGYKAIENE